MLPYAVPTVNIYVVSAVVPNLDDGERRHHIGKKRGHCDKAVIKDMQQLIIPPDDIYENQVINKLDVFDLFLFWLQNLPNHLCSFQSLSEILSYKMRRLPFFFFRQTVLFFAESDALHSPHEGWSYEAGG